MRSNENSRGKTVKENSPLYVEVSQVRKPPSLKYQSFRFASGSCCRSDMLSWVCFSPMIY
ncbi:hypothetical protein C5167_032693 [Papaver somniferum]|uniref:Uncharacterized protein n=1 Tax=Papaver somniferum TaxID=3469 RepID=A0A4Y7KCA2_PAPSO|nr:hypothetical protein C5167_032693 [Papaver somniferum]